MVLNLPVRNGCTTGAASWPPLADLTPLAPAGMVSLTCVSSVNPETGWNSMVRLLTFVQVPSIDGDSVGQGESAASGDENTTRIGAAPSTVWACAVGVIEVTVSGWTRCLLACLAVE